MPPRYQKLDFRDVETSGEEYTRQAYRPIYTSLRQGPALPPMVVTGVFAKGVKKPKKAYLVVRRPGAGQKRSLDERILFRMLLKIIFF